MANGGGYGGRASASAIGWRIQPTAGEWSERTVALSMRP